jgi:replication-associated recombination protein RarA
MPEALAGTVFYEPLNRGFEQRLQERLDWLKQRRSEKLSERNPD